MTAKIYRFPTNHVAVRVIVSPHEYDPACTCRQCVVRSFEELEAEGFLIGYDLADIPEKGDD